YLEASVYHRGWFGPRDFRGGRGCQVRLHKGIARAIRIMHDTKLLFDCICEAVTEVQGIYFRSPACLSSLRHNIMGPPTGRNLIIEINKHVERHLHYQFPSTLDQLVSMDLQGGSWMDLRSEREEITVIIWDFILDELLEEVVYDLWALKLQFPSQR
ncbi:unnamed protein product, partial [Urochloa humidicola]